MEAVQNNTSFVTQLRNGANIAQNHLSQGLSQKIGSLGGKPFANLINTKQPAQANNPTNEQNHVMARDLPKNKQTHVKDTPTKEFLNRRQVQQSMDQTKPATQTAGTRNGTRVRTGNTVRTNNTSNRHNFGMVDIRKNRNTPVPMVQTSPAVNIKSGGTPNRPVAGNMEQAIVMANDLNPSSLSGRTSIPGINLSPEQNFQDSAVSNLGVLSKILGPDKPSGAVNGFSKFVSNHAAVLEQKFAEAALALRTQKHRPQHNGLLLPTVENALTGTLSARYESGPQGIAAIGYDRNGGTSYGKFQISSRAGTMQNFIAYLDENAPDLGARLKNSGPSNTRSRNGKMPEEWKKIAVEAPERFEKLQDDFIKSSHFEPAAKALAEHKGIDFTALPGALQEVLFSTAVQHGAYGASRIIGKALDRLGIDLGDFQTAMNAENKSNTVIQQAKKLVEHIYDLRASQFGSSTKRIQMAAKQRMQREKQEALQLLTV